MKAGSQGTLAKALGLGRKPPQARARDDIVLSIMPACLCVGRRGLCNECWEEGLLVVWGWGGTFGAHDRILPEAC